MSPTLQTLCIFILGIISCIISFVDSQQLQYNLSASQVFVESAPFNMTLNIYPTKGYLTMNLTGPANKWFGVGFGLLFPF